MAPDGNAWQYMAINGYAWLYIAIHGYAWPVTLILIQLWYTLTTLRKVPIWIWLLSSIAGWQTGMLGNLQSIYNIGPGARSDWSKTHVLSEYKT